MEALYSHLTAFLLNLECLDPHGQRDAIVNAIIETGGTYCPPPDDDDWANHRFEISLFSIAAKGTSENEAIQNWTKAATAQTFGNDTHSEQPASL